MVVPKDGQDVDESGIKSYVRERLRGSRTPDEVVIRAELPYTPTGKLLRRTLLEQLSLVGNH